MRDAPKAMKKDFLNPFFIADFIITTLIGPMGMHMINPTIIPTMIAIKGSPFVWNLEKYKKFSYF